jgi:hypothetical protein
LYVCCYVCAQGMCCDCRCRSQQPLVVQLLKGMQGACSTPAAMTPTLVPAAGLTAAAAAGPAADGTLLQQQQQGYLAVPLLLDQLLRLLLPLPASYQAIGVAGREIGSSAGMANVPLQQHVLELTEAQQLSAVQLLQQLLAAGLLQQQDALLLLSLQPLKLMWQQQQQQLEQAPQCSFSHSQVRLILQLTESLLGVTATARRAAAAAASIDRRGSGSWDSQCAAEHMECMCPLACTAETAAALAVPADDSDAGQQQFVASVKWLLLGLCQIQQQLQQAAWHDHRPDYKGSRQTAALLEALVMWLVEHGESASLTLQGDNQQQQQQQQLTGVTVAELQQLTWQQQLLLSCLLQPQKGNLAATGSHSSSSSSSSSSSGVEGELKRLLQPDSLVARSASSNNSALPGAPLQLAHARQLLLDCCDFAAASNAHALLLAQQCMRLANPADAAAGVSAVDDPPLLLVADTAARSVAAALAAAVQQLQWPMLRQGLTLALGQFLPWAAEHQAARVLLRLLPALLQATLAQPLQQQQQGVSSSCAALDALSASDAGQRLLQHQQQQGAGQVSAGLWCCELQLVVRAVFLFLQHGRWAQPQAVAEVNSNSSSSSGGGSGIEQARQLAAEQCFRHMSLLVLHIASQARGGLASAAAAHSSSSSSSSSAGITQAAATAQKGTGVGPVIGSADSSVELVQVCVQELCRLAAALLGCVDCSSLQVLLLQLLQQLIAGAANSEAAGAGGVVGGADAARPPMPPPPPAPTATEVPAAAATADDRASQTLLQQHPASILTAPGDADDHLQAHDAAVQSRVEGAAAADARPVTPTLPSGWKDEYAYAGVTYGQLLGWVGQQLQLLPQQMQQLLVPAVVHMAEQQLHGLLGRSLTDKEVEGLEDVLLVIAEN